MKLKKIPELTPKMRFARVDALYEHLGEAAYDGNLGAEEVVQFYMNAPDEEIAHFEAELETGNETQAWDIIQQFNGVDLVGIGSDMGAVSQREAKINKYINEHFNRGKETLTYEMLYEMVGQAISEIKPGKKTKMGTTGKGTDLEQALVDAISGIPPKHFQNFVAVAKYDLKKTGAGSGLSVTEAGKLSHGNISDNWKKWGGADNTSKADVSFNKIGVSMKMGPNAMLFGFGPGDAQACMMAAMMAAKPTGLAQDKAAVELLGKLGTMRQEIGRAPLSVLKRAYELRKELPRDVDQALDKAARSIGDDDEGYVWDDSARAGLKKKIAAAIAGDTKKEEEIRGFIEAGKLALGDGSTGPAAAAEYKLGDDIQTTDKSSNATQRNAPNYKIKTDDKVLGQQAMESIDTVGELVKHAKEILGLEKGLKQIEASVKKTLNPASNDSLRLEFYREALTGKQKFQDQENVAEYVYITQDQDALVASVTGDTKKDLKNISHLHLLKPLDDSYIKAIADAATWRGKFRSDGIKVGGKKTGYNLYRSSLIAEINTASAGGKKYMQGWSNMLSNVVKEAVNEGFVTEQELLEEGVFTDIASGIKRVASAVVKKGGEALGWFIEKLTKAIDGVIGWFKDSIVKVIRSAEKLFGVLQETLRGGVPKIIEFFGITPEEIAAAVEPPSDTNTTVFLSELT